MDTSTCDFLLSHEMTLAVRALTARVCQTKPSRARRVIRHNLRGAGNNLTSRLLGDSRRVCLRGYGHGIMSMLANAKHKYSFFARFLSHRVCTSLRL